MKFIKVTGVVLSLHGCLAAMLIFQSGCRTMEYSEEPNVISPSIPMPSSPIEPDYVMDYEEQNVIIENNFIPVPTTSCTRSFVGQPSPSRPVQPIPSNQPKQFQPSQPIQNCRFKPTRPTCDFSKDGLLTSVNDVEPNKSVSSFDSKQPSASQETSYNVKSGDSLWVLSKRYNVSIAELASANGLNRDSTLKVGQKLIIPVGKQSVSLSPSVDGGTYTIAKGDTLSGIASRFKVSVDSIKKANNMQNSVIIAGKKIIIPGVSTQTIAATPMATSKPTQLSASNEGTTYRVQNGDSLSVIANRFGVTVADLMSWNNMTDARKLRAGQSLIVNNQTTPMSLPVQTSIKADSYMSPSNIDASTSEVSEEESIPFDLFEDEDLFDTSDEIPVLTVNQE